MERLKSEDMNRLIIVYTYCNMKLGHFAGFSLNTIILS